MTILIVSDIHYEQGYHHATFEGDAFDWLLGVIKRTGAEDLVGLGDWGYAYTLEEWMDLTKYVRCHGIYGNHDNIPVFGSVKNTNGSHIMAKDGESRPIGGLRFGFINGIMADTRKLKGNVPRKTPDDFRMYAARLKGKIDVLCTHESPMVDEYTGRFHVAPGIMTMKEIIEDLQPMMALHGHLSGPYTVAKIGRTVCVRVDSSPAEKHFVVFDPKTGFGEVRTDAQEEPMETFNTRGL